MPAIVSVVSCTCVNAFASPRIVGSRCRPGSWKYFAIAGSNRLTPYDPIVNRPAQAMSDGRKNLSPALCARAVTLELANRFITIDTRTARTSTRDPLSGYSIECSGRAVRDDAPRLDAVGE